MNFLTENLKAVIAVVVVAIVALFFIVGGGSGPEKAINNQLDRVAELVSFDTPEPQLEQIGKGRKFSNLFTESTYLIAWPGKSAVTTREQIMGFFVSLRRMTSSADVSISNRKITLESGDRTATVTVNVTGKISLAGEQERHSGQYRMEMEKVDGEWLIATVEPLD